MSLVCEAYMGPKPPACASAARIPAATSSEVTSPQFSTFKVKYTAYKTHEIQYTLPRTCPNLLEVKYTSSRICLLAAYP